MDLCLLNNDISFNVLSRLPANLLVQTKTVSKGWQRLIEDLDFMCLQMKNAEQISISGYFFQDKNRYCEVDVHKLSYIPIRAKETKIYQNVLEFLPEKVTIVGSSNGLICCRSCLHSPDPWMYICNPVNKKWMSVKWDRPIERDYFAFSFEPSSTSRSIMNTDYRLVRVFEVNDRTPGKEEYYFTFEIYNWERRVWVKSKEFCYCGHSLCVNKHVLVKSILYWLTYGNKILMFDITNELSLLVELPIPFTEYNGSLICLGESDGKLQCVVVAKEGLYIWALEESFTTNWDLGSFISLEEMELENPEYLRNLAKAVSASVGDFIPHMQPLAFKEGKLFLRVSNFSYLFDIQTKKVCFLCDMSDLCHGYSFPTVIPYSVTLASVANP